jgi:hypothetical protein
MTKEEYEKLKERSEKANKDNDYTKMIMIGSTEWVSMRKYEQDNLCSHPDVGTDGGGDYCKSCGKGW